MLGRARNCDGDSCRIEVTVNGSGAAVGVGPKPTGGLGGDCDNGLCGLPRNMSTEYAPDLSNAMRNAFAPNKGDFFSPGNQLALGCATGEGRLVGSRQTIRGPEGVTGTPMQLMQPGLTGTPTQLMQPPGLLGTPSLLVQPQQPTLTGTPSRVMQPQPSGLTGTPSRVQQSSSGALSGQASLVRQTAGYGLSGNGFAWDAMWPRGDGFVAGQGAMLGVAEQYGRAAPISLRSTGAINLSRPPIPGAESRYATDAAYRDAINAWLQVKPSESQDENFARQEAFAALLRGASETPEQFLVRVNTYASAATTSALARSWVDAMRLAGYLPVAGGGAGGSTTGSGTAPAAGTAGWTPAQISSTVTGIINGASSTILALVAGANAADRQARADAAATAAQRLAAATTLADRITRGVEAASNAKSGAQTARLLLASDRAAAITRLSEAQGNLAVAQAAKAVFQSTGDHSVPPALNTAIGEAAPEIATAFREILASTPANTPSPEPPPSQSTLNTVASQSTGFFANLSPTQKLVGVVAAGAAAVFGYRALSR